MAETPPCTVLNCSAGAEHVWSDHSGYRQWVVEWAVCASHYARLQVHETWAPDYGSPPTWQRRILMGEELTLAAAAAPWLQPRSRVPGSPVPGSRAPGSSAPEADHCRPDHTRVPPQRHPDPDVSEAPGCMVLGCRHTAERLWAHTLTPGRITRWPVCRHHHHRLHAGDRWAPEIGTSTPTSMRGWLLMGDEPSALG